MLSHAQSFATLWTIDHQAPLSMEFSRQEYWNGLPFPSAGDLPDSGIKLRSPALQADSLPSEPLGKLPFGGSTLSCLLACHGDIYLFMVALHLSLLCIGVSLHGFSYCGAQSLGDGFQ